MLLLSSARVAFRLASKPCTGNSLLFLSVCSSVLLHIYYSVLVSICYHFSRICNIPRRIRFYFVKAQNEKAPPSHLALPRLPLFSLPKCWCLKPTKLMCGHTRNRAHRSEKIFWQHFNCMMLIENVVMSLSHRLYSPAENMCHCLLMKSVRLPEHINGNSLTI